MKSNTCCQTSWIINRKLCHWTTNRAPSTQVDGWFKLFLSSIKSTPNGKRKLKILNRILYCCGLMMVMIMVMRRMMLMKIMLNKYKRLVVLGHSCKHTMKKEGVYELSKYKVHHIKVLRWRPRSRWLKVSARSVHHSERHWTGHKQDTPLTSADKGVTTCQLRLYKRNWVRPVIPRPPCCY